MASMTEWVILASIGASLVLAAVGIGSLLIAYRKLKQDDKHHQELVSSLNKVMQSYENDITSLRKVVEDLRKDVGKSPNAEEAKLELERQKLEEQKRQNEWAKWTDIARGVKWYLEQGGEE